MSGPEGTVYVRERGELRCVTAASQPPDCSVRLRVHSSAAATLPGRREHFVSTPDAEGGLRHTAKSLFDVCLLFVADNVQHVESLVGFPEDVAGRLFSAAERKEKFSDPGSAARALRVFGEAYGHLVLESLCLRNRCSLLCEKLEEFKTFRNLLCLDLHGCKLGDDHEIFQHLTSDALASLSRLFLGANGLSDAGVQKLTAPVRVMKRGLENLQVLDLSYNLITEKALGYLSCFRKLQCLDVSETAIKPSTASHRLLRSKMGLVCSESPMEAFCHSRCKTDGWAQEVVNQWELSASKLAVKDPKPRTNALRFYGREKFVRQALQSVPAVCDKSSGDIVRMQFYKPDPNVQTYQTPLKKEECSNSTWPLEKGAKRKLPSERDVTSGQPAKRLPSSPSAEDMDLLNSY
ncbi:leucine-rich repeat-containing protein 42 [Denticeps clupeoides]|uniref:Leucine-rich repeat-containing protein 42 n=1 Tax=Denticeps clupeoides TaxID=299321 RepID=A0AAY4BJ56_9TELE|nr:leucine-rich repeat-containing protein 42 [Denticeps clupeoides]